MSIRNKTVVVTGGSRGLGRGVVETLAANGARVIAVARASDDLEAVGALDGVSTLAADVTDEGAAYRIVDEIRPDVLILNAGAKPPMARLDEISWADFTATWDHDVRAGLYWTQAALNLPMPTAARVLLVSSGAAVNGSQRSGGYAGAKRMLWFIAKYANGVSADKGLDIRFQAILPRQMILGTGVGDRAAGAYAESMGITAQAFVARFGAPMPPRLFGENILAVLEDPAHADGFVFGLNGDSGVSIMERFAE